MCEKKVKCPPIKPCPTDSVKVCPAIKIPSLDDLEKRFNIVKYVERLLTNNDDANKEKLINIAKSINKKYPANTKASNTKASNTKTEGFTDYVEGEDAEAEEEEMAYGDNSVSL